MKQLIRYLNGLASCARTYRWNLYQHQQSYHGTHRVFALMDARDPDHQKKEKELTVQHGEIFESLAQQKERNKETFHAALDIYLQRQKIYRRGHVEFLYAAMDKMKAFSVQRDIETYRKLIDLFPKYKMVPQTTWQAEMQHYPKQQQCCIDILDKMESHGVIPDDKMGYQLIDVFGNESHTFRKYQRMMYWMPKFKYANPYYVPWELPDDHMELAKIALKRMSVDLETKLTVFESKDLESAFDKTYIVSAHCPEQRDLLENHPLDKPLYVEGGFPVWLRSYCLTYFVLRSHITDTYQTFHSQKDKVDDTTFDFSWITGNEEKPKDVLVQPSEHEQADGTVLSMCITGTASKDSLASWIKFLEKTNPKLSQVPVVFLLRTPERGLQVWDGEKEMDSSDVTQAYQYLVHDKTE